MEKPEKSPDGVVKASFPRKDVEVAVDGWKVAPFMGLTSWVAFTPGRKGVAEAMIMGDLVLFEDEVNPVMSVLLERNVCRSRPCTITSSTILPLGTKACLKRPENH